jgi:hypothetical protein
VGLPLAGLLLLGGGAVLVVVTVRSLTGALGPARAAADAYATALVEERWDDAHAMLCDGSKDGLGPDDLAALHGDPPLADSSITGIEVNSSGGRTTGQVTLEFVTEDGLRETTLLALVRDGGDWRPCP